MLLDLFFGYIIYTNGEAHETELPLTTPTVVQFQPSVPRMPSLDLSPVPVVNEQSPIPILNAKAALVMDLSTGTVMFEKNHHERLPIASLTKIMTAVIAMEHYDPNMAVTITSDMRGVPGNVMYLNSGDVLSVEQLLHGALIPSGNDAANSLAYPMGRDTFIGLMNKKAQALNLADTKFSGTIGFDDPNNYSSAYDLALLTQYALEKPLFRSIVANSRYSFTSLSGKNFNLTSTNQLFGSQYTIKGVKTGTTVAAGQCLVTLAENDQGHRVLTVVLGSEDRYTDSKALLDWAFRNWIWE